MKRGFNAELAVSADEVNKLPCGGGKGGNCMGKWREPLTNQVQLADSPVQLGSL